MESMTLKIGLWSCEPTSSGKVEDLYFFYLTRERGISLKSINEDSDSTSSAGFQVLLVFLLLFFFLILDFPF